MSDLFDLSGRRALVTGANKGIGQAIAIALAGQGANVVCAGRRPSDETAQLIAANGGKASNILLDFADPAAYCNRAVFKLSMRIWHAANLASAFRVNNGDDEDAVFGSI